MGKALLKLFLVLATFGLTLNLSAQTCEALHTVSEQPVSFTVFAINPPSLAGAPNHGVVVWEEIAPLAYEVTYTSNPGFGQESGAFDNFSLFIFPIGGGFNITPYCVNVAPVVVRAHHDIALTAVDIPVVVDVTDNDFSTTGAFDLESVSVSNNGTAEIIGDIIRFTPKAGFTGLTDLDYVICVYGVCDVGTVSINVLGEDLSYPQDTVQVFTKLNKEQFILAPENYWLLEEPHSGTYNDLGSVPVYQPSTDFIGEDFLTFRGQGGDEIVYQVNVLDLVANAFAVEDQYYTIADGEVHLRPLYNDLYANLAGCVTYGLPQFGTLIATDNPAEMIYQPPTGWTGIDRVVYSSYPPGCIDEPEVETIYIVVSNFEPETDEVTLYVTAGNNLPITYELPVSTNASWSVIDAPTNGTVSSVDGQLYYEAPENTGSDQLTINYCLTAENGTDCQISKSVVVNLVVNPNNGTSCDDDCVWPGDANADGVVDMADLLPIGLHMGNYGTARETEDNALWCAQSSADWGQSIGGVDLKHADTDGNRFIDHRDTQLIRQNLGLAHKLRPVLPHLDGFEVYLAGDIFAEPGELIALDIIIGNPTAPTGYVGTEDLYGFRLPFVYNPDVIDPNTLAVVFDDDAWVSYDSPVLDMVSNNPDEGLLDAVYSRTNRLPTSGFGKVGTMYVGTEDLYGFREGDEPFTVTIGGREGVALTGAGHLGNVTIHPFELTIIPRIDPQEDLSTVELAETLDEDLLAFPNPTASRLTVHLNGGRDFSDFELTDLSGRTVLQQHGLQTNHQVLDLSHLPNGLYSLRVTTVDGVVTRKVELLR